MSINAMGLVSVPEVTLFASYLCKTIEPRLISVQIGLRLLDGEHWITEFNQMWWSIFDHDPTVEALAMAIRYGQKVNESLKELQK